MNMQSFTQGTPAYRQQVPLTLDDIRRIAPSAFATEAHESRSARFSYIPTVAIIEGMMREGFQPYKATQSRSRIAGKSEFTKHMIRFRAPSASTSLVVGDTVPEVVLVNAHDGTSTYQLSAGFWRLVCSNGLMVAEGLLDSIRIPHKGNIIDAVIEGSNRIVGGTGPAIAAIEDWNHLQLTDGETHAFAEAAHVIRFADSEGKLDTPITAQQLLTPRRRDDSGNSLWQTFNRVQENVIKGDLSARAARKPGERRGRMVTTRQINGIDQDVKLNRALWVLAERMADLKGVARAA